MGDKTKIEWADATWNPIRGCSLVSAGCTNCYAMREAHRLKPYHGLTRMTEHGPVWTGEIRLVPELLDQPLHWKRPRRIFVNSMSDLFHEKVPDEFIMRIFEVMAFCTNHVFQILTKRPGRMSALLGEHLGRWFERGVIEMMRRRAVETEWCIDELDDWPLPNVHLGISCEDQQTADERIPLLLQTPATVRWISAEPLLGLIDLRAATYGTGLKRPSLRVQARQLVNPVSALDWVVIGGESGPRARPFDLKWARDILAQCRAAGVPCFVKQLGAFPVEEREVGTAKGGCAVPIKFNDRKGGDWNEWSDDLKVREYPENSTHVR